MIRTIQKHTTISQQIDLLKSRGLLFGSEELARTVLSDYGYYNIINGYKDLYTYLDPSGSEHYNSGISFEQIYSLFYMDHVIRNQIMIILLDLEESLKSITANVIAEQISTDQNEYLKLVHYQNRRSALYQFSLPAIIDILKKTCCSNKNPIKHHREKYGNVPPWVLFKSLYFSTLINFIRLQKPEIKKAIIQKLYPLSPDRINRYTIELFLDSLFLFLEYRNLCAHGGRVYNHVPSAKIRITDESKIELSSCLKSCSKLDASYGLGRLWVLFSLFRRTDHALNLSETIHKEMVRHCSIFPNDRELLITASGASPIYENI